MIITDTNIKVTKGQSGNEFRRSAKISPVDYPAAPQSIDHGFLHVYPAGKAGQFDFAAEFAKKTALVKKSLFDPFVRL